MDITAIIDQLNDQQRQAVCMTPCNQLILAGAGSGKTKVLVHRIAYLLQTHTAKPSEILAVTFTNKAAAEIKARIAGLIQHQPTHLWIGTFHSLCHRMLRQHHTLCDLPEHFQIIDTDDQLKLIKRIQKEHNLDEQQWPSKQTQAFISKQKEMGRRSHEIPIDQGLELDTFRAIYVRYEQLCRQNGLVDFNELIIRTIELLKGHPNIRTDYQNRFRFKLIDEFQDTNHLQYEWLTLLCGPESHTTAVGDDDQSIYSWRGAEVKFMMSFGQHFKDATTIRLEQNYRSTKTILAAANAVIAHNEHRFGKELWTDNEQDGTIFVYNAFNEQDEAQFIVSKAEQLINEQLEAPKNIAILYRSNTQSRTLEEQLNQHQIPYRVYGGLRFFDRAEIKDALAYIRLSLNPNDDSAIERIINTPPRGIGQVTLDKIRHHAKHHSVSMWQAVMALQKAPNQSKRVTQALTRFTDGITEMSINEGLSPSEHASRIIHGSGLFDFIDQSHRQNSESKRDNLNELILAINQHERHNAPDHSLTDFLAFTSLSSDRVEEQQHNGVQLMTLHAAKGLEFKHVFLCGMEEELFPHRMSSNNPNQLEEERRLCYVGMTRAMQQLYLTYAETRQLYGQEHYQRASRFLDEIPKEHLSYVRHTPKVTTTNAATFRLGQPIIHPKFGEGIVLNYEPDDQGGRIQIRFHHHGVKWLLAQYANLTNA